MVNFPINLRCYVLLGCRVINVILAINIGDSAFFDIAALVRQFGGLRHHQQTESIHWPPPNQNPGYATVPGICGIWRTGREGKGRLAQPVCLSVPLVTHIKHILHRHLPINASTGQPIHNTTPNAAAKQLCRQCQYWPFSDVLSTVQWC